MRERPEAPRTTEGAGIARAQGRPPVRTRPRSQKTRAARGRFPANTDPPTDAGSRASTHHSLSTPPSTSRAAARNGSGTARSRPRAERRAAVARAHKRDDRANASAALRSPRSSPSASRRSTSAASRALYAFAASPERRRWNAISASSGASCSKSSGSSSECTEASASNRRARAPAVFASRAARNSQRACAWSGPRSGQPRTISRYAQSTSAFSRAPLAAASSSPARTCTAARSSPRHSRWVHGPCWLMPSAAASRRTEVATAGSSI
jgi:hypothetical protein